MITPLKADDHSALRQNPYIIIGAGVQGLTFALCLARKGLPVVLLERSGVLGGQARSFHYEGFTFDFGLHAFVTKNPRVENFVREILGADLTSFYPRAASHWGGKKIVEDSSYWHVQNLHKKLYALLPKTENREWSCMRISKPPKIIYPRQGGFGSIFQRMGKLLKKNGGRLMLETPVRAEHLVFIGRRLTHIKIGKTAYRVRGCYWSTGRPFVSDKKPQLKNSSRGARDVLLLYHFLARGRAPLPYHWIRLPETGGPLLPPLAYCPTHFSRRNAPPGHYSIGATIPILAAIKNRRLGSLSAWVRDNPKILLHPTQNYLFRLGLLRPNDVIKSFSEAIALPSIALTAVERGAASKFENFWDASNYTVHSHEESGVSMQIESAMKALDSIHPCSGSANLGHSITDT